MEKINNSTTSSTTHIPSPSTTLAISIQKILTQESTLQKSRKNLKTQDYFNIPIAFQILKSSHSSGKITQTTIFNFIYNNWGLVRGNEEFIVSKINKGVELLLNNFCFGSEKIVEFDE